MNTPTVPVDVLQIMSACAHAAYFGAHYATAKEIDAAREAIAELIESVREYRIELRKPIGCGTYARVVARVDAALARIGQPS